MDATTHLEELGALEGFLQSDRQIETRGARRWPPVASFVSAERAGWRAGTRVHVWRPRKKIGSLDSNHSCSFH